MSGKDRFQITDEELAVICASHSGTDQHLRAIVNLQHKIGVTESALLCGSHAPYDRASRNKLRDQGITPSQNHHNCSGKHTGMLAQAILLDAPLEKYTEIDHPVQQGVIETLSDMIGLKKNEIGLGRDGCSVPTFSIPLFNAAWAWAKLVDPTSLSQKRAECCRQITSAMTCHPFFVAGPGRMDTRLMEIAPEKVVAKGGAEAYQAMGVFPNVISPGSPALGIALKIADGDQGRRARKAVILEVLRQLKVLSNEDLQLLRDAGPVQSISNQAGIVTGEARPCFQLQYT
jgi:L-asparaginase II